MSVSPLSSTSFWYGMSTTGSAAGLGDAVAVAAPSCPTASAETVNKVNEAQKAKVFMEFL
jgi:hypothetical protein